MKVVSVIILGMLATRLSSLYAQDVITLKTGEEIKAKVEEISSSGVKYKRFDNLNCPTIVIEKAKVFAINYENGTKDVFNVVEEPTVKEGKKEFPTGAHGKNFYTGIYLNPLGFVLVGPVLGAELTFKRHLIVDGHLRFFPAGLLTGLVSEGESGVSNIKGIGIGIDVKYFTGKPRGGFYAGPSFEYYKLSYDCRNGKDHWEGNGIFVAATLGYKFQYSSGFYIRAGGSLGISYDFTSSYLDGKDLSGEIGGYYAAEFCIGFAF